MLIKMLQDRLWPHFCLDMKPSQCYDLLMLLRLSSERVRLQRRSMLKAVSIRLLWELSAKFDRDLRLSGATNLEPWQQEIRDYVSTAIKPTTFAQRNLLEWGKQTGLVKVTSARRGRRASVGLRH